MVVSVEDVTPAQNDEPATSSILLGGEDAMEVDENVPTTPLPVYTSNELISQIITPSPFPHHGTGATRFRNALNRVLSHPTSDVEAWQAVIMEASTCYRTLQTAGSLHAVDAHAKLDWIESCYGTLLKYFPYAASYYVTVVEMLLAQSARVGEQDGPLVDYGMEPSQRDARCEQKVNAIFENVLGIHMDGTPTEDKVGGMCTSSVDLWLLYVRKRVRDATRHATATMAPEEREDYIRQETVNAYELAVSQASFVYNNHVLWKQYLSYVKSWNTTTNHGLAQKQMIQLRSIYQRLVTHPMTGLDQLWQEYEAFEKQQNEQLAAALIAEYVPKYQHARSVYLERNRVYNVADLQMTRLATPPVEESEEDYASKMTEEQSLLTLWKKRASYERTNPERLASAELAQRVRQAHKEMTCALTRYPEVWHMWSMWELLGSNHNVEQAVAVLDLAQKHIPDSTLLAYAQAQVVELYSDKPQECMAILEQFVEHTPTTLGYVLYQQMVRRYKGIEAARAVFSKARRVLVDEAGEKGEATAEQEATEVAEGATKTELEGEGSGAAATGDATDKVENGEKRRMVTNRLDPTVGVEETSDELHTSEKQTNDSNASPGVVTWQLYAAHAMIEHRLNHSPAVAARVYELGLRKHVSFLTKPAYILRYAQLLLELRDTENLRALLTRAVAACEAEEGMEDAVAALWDMTLRFEAISSGTDPGNLSVLQSVERKRHAALMGAEVEDVSTGGITESGDAVVGVGSHKSSIAEQLIRSEGYDVSSNIINGMSRSVDVLDVMGLWGSGDGARVRMRGSKSNTEAEDSLGGGKSDASYKRRLRFLTSTGTDSDSALPADSSKVMSARERAGPSVQQAAASLVVQQSPEWLRPMLLLLPASKYRSAAMNKPPPHMIEMALSALRNNTLPDERPIEEASAADSRKRKYEGGDSSDEENGGTAGGYGNQFRARQRARQMDGSAAGTN